MTWQHHNTAGSAYCLLGQSCHHIFLLYTLWVGGQNLERRNVERPIFRNFKITNIKIMKDSSFMGGGQNLERPNVEWTIFRKFETSNIEIKKVESFDFFIFKFISYIYVCLNCSNTQNIWWFIEFKFCGILIILQIVKFWKFTYFRNWRISEIWLFYELVNLENFY